MVWRGERFADAVDDIVGGRGSRGRLLEVVVRRVVAEELELVSALLVQDTRRDREARRVASDVDERPRPDAGEAAAHAVVVREYLAELDRPEGHRPLGGRAPSKGR